MIFLFQNFIPTIYILSLLLSIIIIQNHISDGILLFFNKKAKNIFMSINIFIMLKFPPLKYNLPDKLIYHSQVYKHGYKFEKFNIFSTNPNCQNRGEMYCFKEHILRPDKQDFVPSLYIDFLFSTKSGEGFGTSLLNFAKKYSKEIGCNGRFHLMASSGLLPQKVPHVFYKKCFENDKDLRKFGFSKIRGVKTEREALSKHEKL